MPSALHSEYAQTYDRTAEYVFAYQMVYDMAAAEVNACAQHCSWRKRLGNIAIHIAQKLTNNHLLVLHTYTYTNIHTHT